MLEGMKLPWHRGTGEQQTTEHYDDGGGVGAEYVEAGPVHPQRDEDVQASRDAWHKARHWQKES
jgi:hypothetical protein